MNIVLKRYLACRTFSKCQPNSNKNCSSLRAYTYKIHADSQLHKCVCGALSIKMTVLQKCPSNVRLPYPQAAAVWWTQSWWKKDWGQRKRYKDSLKDFNMDITTWENAASDRLAWQSTIHRGALHSNVPIPPKKNARYKSVELTTQSTHLSPTGVRPVGGISVLVSASYPTCGHIALLL